MNPFYGKLRPHKEHPQEAMKMPFQLQDTCRVSNVNPLPLESRTKHVHVLPVESASSRPSTFSAPAPLDIEKTIQWQQMDGEARHQIVRYIFFGRIQLCRPFPELFCFCPLSQYPYTIFEQLSATSTDTSKTAYIRELNKSRSPTPTSLASYKSLMIVICKKVVSWQGTAHQRPVIT